jgi:glycerate 2-kinase
MKGALDLVRALYDEVAGRVDGAALVEAAASAGLAGAPVLAVGKAALSMLEGLERAVGPAPAALAIAPEGSDPRVIIADHPRPTERSVAAAAQARRFVAAATDRLVVLLSGGGSALMCAPGPGLSLEVKAATVAALGRAGATIGQLNTVRKHLSAVKGGRLALETGAAVTVLALSDVVGNDPGTIASGPFSPDPTTFAEAAALVSRFCPDAPGLDFLRRGAAGELPETPKPGHPGLARVRYQVIAGPDRVVEEARRSVAARDLHAGVLATDTEAPVEDLARAYAGFTGKVPGTVLTGKVPGTVLIGNGEPRIVVPAGAGRGGRATHLALLMARGMAGRAGVAFLAAGTDRRDGSAPASGAAVDGDTWARAVSAGLDPEGALARYDSATPLEQLGCLVHTPARSNLLDLHLLAICPGTSR